MQTINKKILPKTKMEIAHEYGLSAATIKRYFEAIGIFTRKMITVKQLREFYEHYGRPE
jgi:response regulator of citrate/malate metabolism